MSHQSPPTNPLFTSGHTHLEREQFFQDQGGEEFPIARPDGIRLGADRFEHSERPGIPGSFLLAALSEDERIERAISSNNIPDMKIMLNVLTKREAMYGIGADLALLIQIKKIQNALRASGDAPDQTNRDDPTLPILMRRLAVLKEQKARMGTLATSPHVIIEIVDLEDRIANLIGKKPPASQPVPMPTRAANRPVSPNVPSRPRAGEAPTSLPIKLWMQKQALLDQLRDNYSRAKTHLGNLQILMTNARSTRITEFLPLWSAYSNEFNNLRAEIKGLELRYNDFIDIFNRSQLEQPEIDLINASLAFIIDHGGKPAITYEEFFNQARNASASTAGSAVGIGALGTEPTRADTLTLLESFQGLILDPHRQRLFQIHLSNLRVLTAQLAQAGSHPAVSQVNQFNYEVEQMQTILAAESVVVPKIMKAPIPAEPPKAYDDEEAQMGIGSSPTWANTVRFMESYKGGIVGDHQVKLFEIDLRNLRILADQLTCYGIEAPLYLLNRFNDELEVMKTLLERQNLLAKEQFDNMLATFVKASNSGRKGERGFALIAEMRVDGSPDFFPTFRAIGARVSPFATQHAGRGALFIGADMASDVFSGLVTGNGGRISHASPEHALSYYGPLALGGEIARLIGRPLLPDPALTNPLATARRLAFGRSLPLLGAITAAEYVETGQVDLAMLPVSMANIGVASYVAHRSARALFGFRAVRNLAKILRLVRTPVMTVGMTSLGALALLAGEFTLLKLMGDAELFAARLYQRLQLENEVNSLIRLATQTGSSMAIHRNMALIMRVSQMLQEKMLQLVGLREQWMAFIHALRDEKINELPHDFPVETLYRNSLPSVRYVANPRAIEKIEHEARSQIQDFEKDMIAYNMLVVKLREALVNLDQVVVSTQTGALAMAQ